MYKINVKPISTLEGFDKEEFNLTKLPYESIPLCHLCPKFRNKIVEEAKKVDDICYATIETEEGTKVVTQHLNKGRSMSIGMVLYNAEEIFCETDTSVRAITFNKSNNKMDALTKHITSVNLVYSEGNVWK